MDLLSIVARTNKEPVFHELDGCKYYFARLSAGQKDRFDLQYGSFKDDRETVEGFRAFVVAFCSCDEAGTLTYDSGQNEKAKESFVKVVDQLIDSDSSKLEPFFELAAITNGMIKSKAEDDDPN